MRGQRNAGHGEGADGKKVVIEQKPEYSYYQFKKCAGKYTDEELNTMKALAEAIASFKCFTGSFQVTEQNGHCGLNTRLQKACAKLVRDQIYQLYGAGSGTEGSGTAPAQVSSSAGLLPAVGRWG